MSYISVIACLCIISGTLLTNGLPNGHPEQPETRTPGPAPKAEVGAPQNVSIAEGNGASQSPSLSVPLSAVRHEIPVKDSIPVTNGSSTTEVAPGAKNETTTTPKPTPETTVSTSSEKPSTTTSTTTTVATTPTKATTTSASTITSTTSVKPTSITPTSTKAPTPTTTSAPESGRRFDGPSFIGGIVLAVGLTAITFIAWKFYKARTERNYHTL